MCGIFLVFTYRSTPSDTHKLLKAYEACKSELNRRGPDYQFMQVVDFEGVNLLFASSVLWLQGKEVIKQPVITKNSIFLYNGNLYEHTKLENSQSDTHLLLDTLENSDDIVSAVSQLTGPYTFIYCDKRNSRLYFGRDIYGRRSLIIGTNGSNLVLTSVASKALQYNCMEVPAIGLFCYDFNSKNMHIYPWKIQYKNFRMKLKDIEELLDKTIEVKEQTQNFLKAYISPTDTNLFYSEELQRVDFNEALPFLLTQKAWKTRVENLQKLLEAAVERRVKTQPEFCQNCIKSRNVCNHTTTGILFSGGIDCSILALLANSFVDPNRPIDLLNVAFKKDAPDRQTALEILEELRILQPKRIWNFVEINIAEDELILERNRSISNLIYPRNTILDDSLGCAIWFASRGQSETYTSPCRILLVGMGADELFGGYTKHRAALKHGGWYALHESLEEDWQNISHRNLARDDRVVSDHGRQLCTPYLDECVVEFSRNLHSWEKTCPISELPQGLGEKILLRALAYNLGLKNGAYFKKRALQFGSRIANRKENANNVSPRL